MRRHHHESSSSQSNRGGRHHDSRNSRDHDRRDRGRNIRRERIENRVDRGHHNRQHVRRAHIDNNSRERRQHNRSDNTRHHGRDNADVCDTLNLIEDHIDAASISAILDTLASSVDFGSVVVLCKGCNPPNNMREPYYDQKCTCISVYCPLCSPISTIDYEYDPVFPFARGFNQCNCSE